VRKKMISKGLSSVQGGLIKKVDARAIKVVEN